MAGSERFDTIVVGAGQAGLAMGHHLARMGRSFVVLDAGARVGDAWRSRWDSLRLFTPARYDALPGSSFPAPPWSFPTKDEFADYLADYATGQGLPVRNGVRVERLHHDGGRFVLEAGDRRWEADNVVVATGYDRVPKTPHFAAELDPAIRQVHATDYRNPDDLVPGGVLVVGAGNSGADLALEASSDHHTFLAGRHPGQLPWRIDGRAIRPLTGLVFFAFSHVLTVRTPVGRRLRPRLLAHSGPLIRVKSKDLLAAGVERVPRVEGVRDGRPVLADGRTLDVANVVWCTGFEPDTSWIDLPVFDGDGQPRQRRGVVEDQPGLYFLGWLFQFGVASSMIHGVADEAGHVARHLAAQRPVGGQATAAGQPSTLAAE